MTFVEIAQNSISLEALKYFLVVFGTICVAIVVMAYLYWEKEHDKRCPICNPKLRTADDHAKLFSKQKITPAPNGKVNDRGNRYPGDR